MNWEDEAFKESANRGNALTGPETGEFVDGAKWQRDQLRTDEAIERLANFLFADDNGESIDQHEKICHDVSKCQLRNGYTQFARAAITALLGED